MAEPGGFVIPISPPRSNASPGPGSQLLPRPASRPPRSREALVNQIDRSLLHISRRYEKRGIDSDQQAKDAGAQVQGYPSFTSMAKDLSELIDVVWAAGAPKVQIASLLSIAQTSCASLPAFPFAARPSFQLFKKLDEAFWSLLTGTVSGTGEILPGTEGGRAKPTVTEMIRLRGIAERTRVAVVAATDRADGSNGGVSVTGDTVEEATDDDSAISSGDDVDTEMTDGEEMEIARVYERTISELGRLLSNT